MLVNQLPTFHHILALGEIHIPEALCVEIATGRSQSEVPVSVSRDGEPRLIVVLEVRPLWNRSASIGITKWEYPYPTILEVRLTVTKNPKHERETTRYVLFKREEASSVTAVDMKDVRCFTVQLRVYSAPKVQVPTLVARLNEARLQGDPQCDASLCAEDEWFPAHRLVLATQSPVFAKMFGGDFKEAGDGRVHLKGVSKEAAKLFLEFMYTDRLKKCAGLELELLDLAERYCMEQLKQECRLRLWIVAAPRALQVLRELPNPHVDPDMKKRLVRIVVDNWQATTQSHEWQEFQEENPLAAELLVAVSSSEPTVSVMQPL